MDVGRVTDEQIAGVHDFAEASTERSLPTRSSARRTRSCEITAQRSATDRAQRSPRTSRPMFRFRVTSVDDVQPVERELAVLPGVRQVVSTWAIRRPTRARAPSSIPTPRRRRCRPHPPSSSRRTVSVHHRGRHTGLRRNADDTRGRVVDQRLLKRRPRHRSRHAHDPGDVERDPVRRARSSRLQ